MDDENANKKRKPKWDIAYSKISLADAEKRLGFRIGDVKAVSVERMLAGFKPEGLGGDKTKEEAYKGIMQYIIIEGYPTEAVPEFNESNVSDLIFVIISPILFDLICNTERNLRLQRENEIIPVDGEEEFVVIDWVSVSEEEFVMVVEGKRSSIGQAMKQCLLSLKDVGGNNGGSEVYGFVTTGESWRMIRYDGTFLMTNKFHATFDTIGDEKEKWMKDYSLVVDCLYFALINGGL